MKENIEKFFKLKHKKTDIRTEILAGITTFLTMSYIIIVNPQILSAGNSVPYPGALTATIIVSALSSILMGLYSNTPFALAPGMGINAFFTFTVVMGMGIDWKVALGTVFISGIIFIILTLLKIRTSIVRAIPKCVVDGVAAGIGIFLAFIGLTESGFIQSNPVTYLSMGDFSAKMVLFIIGFIFTTILVSKKVKGALLFGIIFTTIISFMSGRVFGNDILITIPETLTSKPDFSSAFLKLDIMGALKFSMIGVILTFLFTDLFDSISTYLGVAHAANMLDENGEPENIDESLLVDAVSTIMSGLMGTSAGTVFVESASGIEEGGRSGLTAVVTGILFLPFLYFAPAIAMIPLFAAAPALVIVGFFMTKPLAEVDFTKMEQSLPAFLGMILIPLTYSITQGISWSIIIYTILNVFNGKMKEIPLMLYILTVISVIVLFLV